VTFEIYRPGHVKNAAHDALRDMMADFDPGKSYADMMRHRISGKAADACHDIYYVAHENGAARSRLWMGWGRHADAIGNWGNFYTDEAFRSQGLGKALLDLWFEDLQHTAQPPLCLLCTTGSAWVTKLYARYGFRTVMKGQEYGPLYKPVGDSPATFDAFCDTYYHPSDSLLWRVADIAYRHEIDCLLRFVFAARGLTFGIGEVGSVEAGLLYHPTRTGMLFSADGHCVGWTFDGQAQVHPMYTKASII
jgi:GNAT superfamily N-acetyltransferase